MTVEQPIVRPAEPTRHRITVSEFLALDEAGFFEGRHVELVDGEIFEMAPLYYPHGRIALELTVAIGLAVRDIAGFEVSTPVSAELDENSLPEPDISICRIGGGDRFLMPEFVQILVEVSASSLRHDLGPKWRLYARADVPEYWVVDINGREIVRFHTPDGEVYLERATFAFGEPVPSATIPGLTVDTSRLV